MSTPKQDSSVKPVQRDEGLRRRFERFRILILGRANAGKTTILQKVCKTEEQPEIFDSKGNKVDTSVVTPAAGRGAHNIHCEMIFKSNPGFVFHDSRGFEAGDDDELATVQDFIARRAQEKSVSNQLHAIWYCIPMDDSRPITVAEESFFSKCGTGKVPVVAVFTKMDALDSDTWNELMKQNMTEEEAYQQARSQSLSVARDLYSNELVEKRYPPEGSVYMRDMNRDGMHCEELIRETVSVLDDSNLQLLLVSTQQVSIEICITYALRSMMKEVFERSSLMGRIKKKDANLENSVKLQKNLFYWFPHCGLARHRLRHDPLRLVRLLDAVPRLGHLGHLLLPDYDALLPLDGSISSFISSSKIQSHVHSLIGPSPPRQYIVCLGVALLIILEHSYFLWDCSQGDNVSPIMAAITIYKESHISEGVIQAVDQCFQEDQMASFGWLAPHIHTDAQRSIVDKLLKIVLDNRLSKDSLKDQLEMMSQINMRDWID